MATEQKIELSWLVPRKKSLRSITTVRTSNPLNSVNRQTHFYKKQTVQSLGMSLKDVAVVIEQF